DSTGRYGTNYTIWTMNADGSNLQRLTSGTRDLNPSFSPDGTRLVYFRGDSPGGGDPEQDWIMDANGANQTRLIVGVGADDTPSYLHDGSKIIFSWKVPPEGYKHICSANPDGSGI